MGAGARGPGWRRVGGERRALSWVAEFRVARWPEVREAALGSAVATRRCRGLRGGGLEGDSAQVRERGRA